MRRWARSVAAVALVLSGCSAPQEPNNHGLPTPLGVDAGASADDAASADAGAAASALALEDFTPLLALPKLEKAREEAEKGRHRAAASMVSELLEKEPPPVSEVPTWQYLLGSLHERAGDLERARASYELAAAENWELRDYAWLAAGRVRLRLGHHADALERLKQVDLTLPIGAEARLLMAEAATQTEPEKALEVWRAHLASDEHPRDWMSVSLRLADLLLDRASKAGTTLPNGSPHVDAVLEALRIARRVRIESARSTSVTQRASKLEQRALKTLPLAQRRQHARPGLELEMLRVQTLLAAGMDTGAQDAADALLHDMSDAQRYGAVGCQLGVLRAKAIAARRKRGVAADELAEVIRRCKDPDLHARALYLGGKYAALDGRHTQAIQRYQQLEKDHPKHRLADDARLKAAFSYYELGVEKRFTELLSTMAEDYPDGDMVLDGVFRLALRRIEKGDWSGATSVLAKAVEAAKPREGARGREYSGRERYYLARALLETGQGPQGRDQLEAVIREQPLSYYMLHAYSRLHALDSQRAEKARDEALATAKQQPFRFEHHAEFDTPGFRRAMALLRLGETRQAKTELRAAGLWKRGTAPQVLWGIALLYHRAGSARLSHAVARGLLTDWPRRWPAGDWVQAWKIAFPRPYHSLVSRNAKKRGIAESLAYAVMREESAFDPRAVSPAKAYGLMQIIEPTAKEAAKPLGLPSSPAALKRPPVNVAIGCALLGKLTQSFESYPLLAIPSYNAGPGRPRRWLRERPNLDFDLWVEAIPFSETRRYTKRVLASRAAYAFLYDNENAESAMQLPLRIVR